MRSEDLVTGPATRCDSRGAGRAHVVATRRRSAGLERPRPSFEARAAFARLRRAHIIRARVEAGSVRVRIAGEPGLSGCGTCRSSRPLRGRRSRSRSTIRSRRRRSITTSRLDGRPPDGAWRHSRRFERRPSRASTWPARDRRERPRAPVVGPAPIPVRQTLDEVLQEVEALGRPSGSTPTSQSSRRGPRRGRRE